MVTSDIFLFYFSGIIALVRICKIKLGKGCGLAAAAAAAATAAKSLQSFVSGRKRDQETSKQKKL